MNNQALQSPRLPQMETGEVLFCYVYSIAARAASDALAEDGAGFGVIRILTPTGWAVPIGVA